MNNPVEFQQDIIQVLSTLGARVSFSFLASQKVCNHLSFPFDCYDSSTLKSVPSHWEHIVDTLSNLYQTKF